MKLQATSAVSGAELLPVSPGYLTSDSSHLKFLTMEQPNQLCEDRSFHLLGYVPGVDMEQMQLDHR
jgi:hypothetical protein